MKTSSINPIDIPIRWVLLGAARKLFIKVSKKIFMIYFDMLIRISRKSININYPISNDFIVLFLGFAYYESRALVTFSREALRVVILT